MKTNVMISAAVIALGAWGLVNQLSHGAERPRSNSSQLFMRQKMVWSQAIMEGLTLEKFDLVSKSAIRMRDMTLSNAWLKVKNPDYMQQTTNFYKNVDALYFSAVDKNLDAATEAYVKVARNCIECHRVVRAEQRKVAVPAVRPAGEITRP